MRGLWHRYHFVAQVWLGAGTTHLTNGSVDKQLNFICVNEIAMQCMTVQKFEQLYLAAKRSYALPPAKAEEIDAAYRKYVRAMELLKGDPQMVVQFSPREDGTLGVALS